jgi:hypothetical protein
MLGGQEALILSIPAGPIHFQFTATTSLKTTLPGFLTADGKSATIRHPLET